MADEKKKKAPAKKKAAPKVEQQPKPEAKQKEPQYRVVRRFYENGRLFLPGIRALDGLDEKRLNSLLEGGYIAPYKE